MDLILYIIVAFFGFLITILFYKINKYRIKKRVSPSTKKFYIYCEKTNNFDSSKLEIINNRQCILLKKSKTIFGRAKSIDVNINDIGVSRKHFMIILEENACFIVDCGSSNGTFVNGKRVHNQKLVSGDNILVGQTLMVFCQK